jgi:hypothetical protein
MSSAITPYYEMPIQLVVGYSDYFHSTYQEECLFFGRELLLVQLHSSGSQTISARGDEKHSPWLTHGARADFVSQSPVIELSVVERHVLKKREHSLKSLWRACWTLVHNGVLHELPPMMWLSARQVRQV